MVHLLHLARSTKIQHEHTWLVWFLAVLDLGLLNQFPPSRYFPDFSPLSKLWLPRDSYNLTGIFSRSKISLTNKLANRALVTFNPDRHNWSPSGHVTGACQRTEMKFGPSNNLMHFWDVHTHTCILCSRYFLMQCTSTLRSWTTYDQYITIKSPITWHTWCRRRYQGRDWVSFWHICLVMYNIHSII